MGTALRAVRIPAAAILLTGIAFVATFAYRLDYAGHHVAGFGGTMLLLSAAAWFRRATMGWWAVAAAVVAILIGVGTEATIFRLAIFDPVDLANQSLGAALASCGVIDLRGSRAAAAGLAGLGLAALAVGWQLAFA